MPFRDAFNSSCLLFTVQYSYYTGLDSLVTMERLICWRNSSVSATAVWNSLLVYWCRSAEFLKNCVRRHKLRSHRLLPVLCNGSTNCRSKCFETKHVLPQATLSFWLIEKCKNRPKTSGSVSLKQNHRNRVFGFQNLTSVRFDSVFKKPQTEIFNGFHTPLIKSFHFLNRW